MWGLPCPGHCEAGAPSRAVWEPRCFHPLLSPQPSSRERTGVHRLRGALVQQRPRSAAAGGCSRGPRPRSQGAVAVHTWKKRKTFPPGGGGYPSCEGPQRRRPLSPRLGVKEHTRRALLFLCSKRGRPLPELLCVGSPAACSSPLQVTQSGVSRLPLRAKRVDRL